MCHGVGGWTRFYWSQTFMILTIFFLSKKRCRWSSKITRSSDRIQGMPSELCPWRIHSLNWTVFIQSFISYVGCSKSNVFSLFPWKPQQVQRVQWHCWIEKILSYTHYISAVTTVSCAFLSVMNMSLYATLVRICMAAWNVAYLSHCCCHCLAVLTSTVWSPEMFSKHQWMSTGAIFFLPGGIHLLTFVSSILPCQTPCCHTVPLCCHLSHSNNM